MRILYATTIGKTMGFFKSLVHELIEIGHTVEIATNEIEAPVPNCYREWNCKVHQISCSRSPVNIGNLKAIRQLKELVEKERYDIVHCHTPIAAACVRLACRKARKQGTRVIYTAHGFHFYTGAPLKNWLIYYPVEKLCARWTDLLITINKEDYERAKKKVRAKRIEYVPGVGIDVGKFRNVAVNKANKRAEIGVPADASLLLSVGELNRNKNHEVVIRAIKELHNPNIHYAIAGQGGLYDYLLSLAGQLGVSKQVHLLGYRSDVAELYKAADVFVHPSFREGLPVSVMEAMASGLPVIASKIRGCSDLVNELVPPTESQAFAIKIEELMNVKGNVGEHNRVEAEKYDVSAINEQMKAVYKGVL